MPSRACSTARCRPASTSSATASNPASASRCIYRCGWKASAESRFDRRRAISTTFRCSGNGCGRSAAAAIASPIRRRRSARSATPEWRLRRAEYELFKNALASLRQQPAETFMTAASPGIIATTMVNEYYDSYEAYVFALARELRKEYELISSYGFLLQLDAPDFGLERARHVQGQNRRGVPARDGAQRRGDQSRDRRNSTRPDPAAHLLGQLGGAAHPRFPAGRPAADSLSAPRVGALSIEFANPRHQHEYARCRKHPLPPI